MGGYTYGANLKVSMKVLSERQLHCNRFVV
jgi:hypothetical protein